MDVQANPRSIKPFELTIPPGAHWKGFVLVSAVGVLLLLSGLGARDLWSPDEPRVAAIAKEMAERGDFLVPRLDGTPFLEKPPLFFAACAMSGRLFGKDDLFALRLPSAVAGIAVMLLCAAISLMAYDSWVAGLVAACMLGTSRKFWEVGRWLVVDMMLTMFVTAALVSFYLAIGSTPRRRRWCEVVMTIALVGAVMTKNLVGLAIPFVAMVCCLLFLREFRLRVWLGLLCCYVVAALIWSGWVWALYQQLGPDAVRETAWVNTIGRFTGSRASHVNPLYFYIATVPSGFLPWALFLPGALLKVAKQRHITSHKAVADRLLLVSFGAPFVLLSLSAGKRLLYAVPLLPILAAIAGGWVAQMIEDPGAGLRAWFRAPCQIVRVLLACLILMIPGALIYLKAGACPIIAASAICLAGIAILIRWSAPAAAGRCTAALLIVQIVSFTEFGLLVMPAADKLKSFRPVVQMAAPYLEQGVDTYLLTDKESLIGAARFYLDREIPMLRTTLDVERFKTSPRPAVCLIRAGRLKGFRISRDTVLSSRRRRKHEPVLLIGNRALMLARGRDSQVRPPGPPRSTTVDRGRDQ